MDGNGRVGRALTTYILKKKGYGFQGLVSLEEYLDQNKSDYYDLLDSGKLNITPFIEFFLQALTFQAKKALEEIKTKPYGDTDEDSLLPRRKEILDIIRDHKMVNFDLLRRRFMSVAQSTLHYDLKMLLKQNLIKKMGMTRGVYYGPK